MLAAINGFASLLLQDIPINDSKNEYIKKILDGTSRLENILTEVDVFNQPEACSILTIDLRTELRNIIASLMENKKIEFSTQFSKQVVPVRLAPFLFEPMVRRIIGKLSACTTHVNVKISVLSKKQQAQLKIFSHAKNSNQIAPFPSFPELSLSVFQKIIELHNSEIEFDSRKKTIIITLPLIDE